MREYLTPTVLTPQMAFFEMWMTYWYEFWMEGACQSMQLCCAPFCAEALPRKSGPFQMFVPMPFRVDEEQDLFA